MADTNWTERDQEYWMDLCREVFPVRQDIITTFREYSVPTHSLNNCAPTPVIVLRMYLELKRLDIELAHLKGIPQQDQLLWTCRECELEFEKELVQKYTRCH